MLQNLKTGAEIAIGFALLIAITLVIGVIGYIGLNNAEGDIKEVVEQDVLFASKVNNAEVSLLTLRRYEKDFLLNVGKGDKQTEYLKLK